jgi:glutamate 5-kinase
VLLLLLLLLPVPAAVPVRGSIWMDAGAMHAIRDRHKSLFPVGVIKVLGDFAAQVSCQA